MQGLVAQLEEMLPMKEGSRERTLMHATIVFFPIAHAGVDKPASSSDCRMSFWTTDFFLIRAHAKRVGIKNKSSGGSPAYKRASFFYTPGYLPTFLGMRAPRRRVQKNGRGKKRPGDTFACVFKYFFMYTIVQHPSCANIEPPRSLGLNKKSG